MFNWFCKKKAPCKKQPSFTIHFLAENKWVVLDEEGRGVSAGGHAESYGFRWVDPSYIIQYCVVSSFTEAQELMAKAMSMQAPVDRFPEYTRLKEILKCH